MPTAIEYCNCVLENASDVRINDSTLKYDLLRKKRVLEIKVGVSVWRFIGAICFAIIAPQIT